MIGLALFGAGRIGAVHAANIAANAKARLVSVHDVNAVPARQIAARHGARLAAGAAEVLADGSVDAVVIANSTDTHVELIAAAARAGKSVFCEKPIDLDIARVEQCRRQIANTFIDRYFEAYRRELDDFIETVQSGGEPAVGFEDGRRAQPQVIPTSRCAWWCRSRRAARARSSAG